MNTPARALRGAGVALAFLAVVAGSAYAATSPGLRLLEEYKFVALESEVAGIYPHPTDDDLFLVAANGNPAYAAGQRSILPVQHRGKLLVVNRRTGDIVRTLALTGGNYGGIAYGGGTLFVSRLDPPEVLKVDLESGRILGRISLPGPAGGLEYDAGRSLLMAQLYLAHPHLAVIEPRSGVVIDKIFSDENAMDLAMVGGDLLCTWSSSFDAHAFGELRRIDRVTGRVTDRLRLDSVHTSMAPLDRRVSGVEGFISLARTGSGSQRVTVRRYGYDGNSVSWIQVATR